MEELRIACPSAGPEKGFSAPLPTPTPLPPPAAGMRWVGPVEKKVRKAWYALDAWVLREELTRDYFTTEERCDAPILGLVGGLTPVLCMDGGVETASQARRLHHATEGWYVEVPARVSALAQNIWWQSQGKEAVTGLLPVEKGSCKTPEFIAAYEAAMKAERELYK